MFLDFFKSKGHAVEPSASLIPVDDPTLLWINSGVATLKKYFDGSVIPDNPRITNAQKSIRTNDIELVGKTARHLTFFEMLGNFSVGDYFKKEVIPWAWELLTSPKWFDFDPKRLYVTVYPKDKGTKELWRKVGLQMIILLRLRITSGISAKVHLVRIPKSFMIVASPLTMWLRMIRKTILVARIHVMLKSGTSCLFRA